MKCPFVIKKCSVCGKLLVAYNGNFAKKKAGKWGLAAHCKQCKKQYDKKYRKDFKEEKAARDKRYYENNKEQIKQRVRQYSKDNPHIQFNRNNKRRQLEESQGRGINKEQWIEIMNFFGWKCAYSNESLTPDNRTIDHIIALNNGGLNEPWNCIPCLDSYNSSKCTQDMIAWYKQQEFFDIDRLMKIYEWQEYAFEKWGM